MTTNISLTSLLFIVEILLIIFIVYLQVSSFVRTKRAMKSFSSDIKDAFSNLKLSFIKYKSDDLKESNVFSTIIACNEYLDDEDSEDGKINLSETIELVNSPILNSDKDNEFRDVILSTNSYLVKNKGVASDFGIIQDICERRIDSTDDTISESISTPLFLGLGGTFIGIICGVISLFVSGADNANVLFIDVAIAMFASFLGLTLMLWNKVVLYPKITSNVSKYKNVYYDFVQRELMPALSLGVAGTLASFKDVLGNFISKFGNNISGYAETAKLMNQNLESEYLVLQEINNLNISKASKVIADSFATLKESSEELRIFKEYQSSLNMTIEKATVITERMEGIMSTFENFISILDRVAKQSDETTALQKQFKESLETHFPTIKEHETLWREQLDEIGSDAKRSSDELQEHLRTVTEYMRAFVGDNATFISSVVDMKEAISMTKANAEHQDATFEAYKQSMMCLKDSIDRLYDRETENQSSVLLALKALLEQNTNPEYTRKLTEIYDALIKLQDGQTKVLNETRETLVEIKRVAEDQKSEVEEAKSKLDSHQS